MPEIDGATLVARSLKQQGVDYMFGVYGFPIMPVAHAAMSEGIRYIGMRNEQAASYAAGAVGYLTGRPGACLAVSGPGMIHAVAGLANAWANCWPMILVAGASDSNQDGQGAFQEAPQRDVARPFAKQVARPESLTRIPYYVEQAVRTSIYGRPGAVYLDLPGDLLFGRIDAEEVASAPRCPDPPRAVADPEAVRRALEVLRQAERPLVIIGKGTAYARAENEARAFIEVTRLPFLATPMGKGVVPDDHELSVAPARSFALRHADAVLLIGARLNWILHFGRPPRFRPDVRVIQLDIAGEEIGTNVPVEVGLLGDARAVLAQMNAALVETPARFASDSHWWNELSDKIEENRQMVQPMLDDDRTPMGYYRVLREIRDALPRDAIVCSEGANTMDIGRAVLPNFEPRHRLDAGTFGTMGVGLAFAIAASTVHPHKKVVAVEGDSAFGFSGMEVEVACRYRMPITFIIINNNGIGTGVGRLDEGRDVPPFAYLPGAHYERMIEGFGGKGWCVTRPAELGPVLKEALSDPMPNIVNIQIDPKARSKPQPFSWTQDMSMGRSRGS